MVEDTAGRDPLLHLAGVMEAGSPEAYITGMEAAGQRQLLASAALPTEMQPDIAAFEALGFVFGPPNPRDPLFRPATLPAGWRKDGSDHAMWSYVLDERGLRRVGVFYKAASYDRRAAMHLINVGRDQATDAIYGDGPVSIPWGLLTPAERADVRASAEDYLQQAEEHPAIYGARAARAQQVLDGAP